MNSKRISNSKFILKSLQLNKKNILRNKKKIQIYFTLSFGAQSELSKFYSNCALYISTSLSDGGLASSTAEAMAAGAISIITNVKENKKWVNTKDNNGAIFEPKNANQLSRMIKKLLSLSIEERTLMSKNSRKKILLESNIEIEIKKFCDLIKSFNF